jgi:hypothetical protein
VLYDGASSIGMVQPDDHVIGAVTIRAPRSPQEVTGRAWVIFVDDLHPNLNDAAWQKYWTTTRNSLQVIAEQTGGFVIQENLEDGLKRIVE